MIAAILSADAGRTTRFTLVESDVRKAAFLSTVSRELGLDVLVLSERVETLAPLSADVLSARALAPLEKLIEYAKRHLAPDGVALFPKGAKHADELQQAIDKHHFSYRAAKSLTDPDAVIYQIRGAFLD
jgi:16S rRNA (guanine527-N7)-methyltransferase